VEKVTAIKPKLGDELRSQMMQVAIKATAEERKQVDSLILKATDSEYRTDLVTFTPAMAALIFLEHNPHNRDWSPQWTTEIARRMKDGQWRQNNALPGFYTTGQLEDGQHRFGGVALSGVPWRTLVVLGIETESIASVDAGKKRHGADAAQLDGVENTKLKQSILKTSANYLVKLGNKDAAIISEMEMAKAIKKHDQELVTAIDIANTAAQNLVTPILRQPQAATIAYLMLQHGWPELRIREKLALINSGQSSGGEAEPFFVAGDIITKSRDKQASRDKLSALNEVGLVILVMGMTEQGVDAIRKAVLMQNLKKALPDPTYHQPQQAQAA
jgi:hypothetical protein